MIATDDTTALLKRIADALERPPLDKQLWDVGAVARYLDVSKETVMRYSGMPGFPKAARLPTPGGLGPLRWLAKEVMQWVERQKR